MNVTTFVCVLFLFASSVVPLSVYETHQNIERQGYVAETHFVTTHDGYILEVHRIPFRRNESSGLADRPVVFLMHGLTAASNSYILLGSEYSIAFNLADAGFDVWMGNARGNRNSRRHVTMDPNINRVEFFDFSWHEIGTIDVAESIDYILELTGNKRLHYIGHSQGGTSFLVLTSSRPEYNEKIASAHLLAGVGYKDNFPHTALSLLARFTDVLWNLAKNIGFVELFPPSALFPLTQNGEAWENCAGDIKLKDFCDLIQIRELMYDTNETGIELSIGGASLKQFAHYGQNIRDKEFRQWNYGTAQNIEKYGTPDPPIYDISLITVPVTMHYTISDVLLDEKDVHAMARDMPNTVVRRVARDTFGHEEFVTSEDVKALVTDYIVDAIASFEDSIEPGPGVPDSSNTVLLSSVLKIFIIYLFINNLCTRYTVD